MKTPLFMTEGERKEITGDKENSGTSESNVKRLVIRFFIFMIVWIAGCAMADYVFLFEDRAWSMWWGYFVGVIAIGAQSVYDV